MEKFVEERLEICKKCPIMRLDPDFGMRCDSRKWLSPDGKQGSFFKHDGWHKGCGCICERRAENINNHCVCKMW